MRMIPQRVGVTVLLMVQACSPRGLPPPAVPPHSIPTVVIELPPPGAGEGRVVLDTTEGPARADEVVQRSENTVIAQGVVSHRGTHFVAPQRLTRPLCLLPCAVNLSLGHHEVLFSLLDDPSRNSAGFISVGASPSVARHAIGRSTTSVGGVIGALVMGVFGFAGLVTGPALLGLGDDEARGRTGFVTAGWVTLGIGVALGAGAVALGLMSRPTVQPGRTIQWTPPALLPSRGAP